MFLNTVCRAILPSIEQVKLSKNWKNRKKGERIRKKNEFVLNFFDITHIDMALGTQWKASVKMASWSLLLATICLLVATVLGQQDPRYRNVGRDDEKIPNSQ